MEPENPPTVPPSVKPQDVLDKLMYDGTFDNLRSSLITVLKSNDDLKSYILTLVENSEVLRNSDVETKSRRQLMEELRNELSSSVLEKVSTAAWELMLSTEGLGMEITEKVDDTFCDLTESSTLGCDCHPGVGSSLKKLGSLDCDSSAAVNTKVVSEQTSVGSKRLREEEVEKPITSSSIEPESAIGTVAVDCKVVVKEEHEPASCNGSTTEMPPQLKHPKGNWDVWVGSSDSINDPHKHDSVGQSSQGKPEERVRENGHMSREQPSGATERPSESCHSDSYDDNMSKPRGPKVV
ncbi:hypothetical protein Mapa_004779 [Marchantia paleacea]|nr:hypothetical protein Mapa_004779 [Marchantia paleacea]